MLGEKLLTQRLPETEEGSEQVETATFSVVAVSELRLNGWSGDQAVLE